MSDIIKVQQGLARKAQADKEHRFRDLYHLLCKREWIEEALWHVLDNDGAQTPGVDEISWKSFNDAEKSDFENEKFRQQFIDELQTELNTRTYQPLPVRRVEIPKPGTNKKRPLGIPIWAVHYPSSQSTFGIPWVFLLVDRSSRSTVIVLLYHKLTSITSTSLLPLAPDWLAQRCDDLRGEGNPAWSQRGGTNTLQDASLAPVCDGRDVDIEQVCCRASRVAAISTLPSWGGFRALGASSRDMIGIANPLDFTDRQRASHASSLSFLIEQGCNLRIRLRRRQLPHALDHLWAGLAFFPRHLVAWDSKTREGLGLPTNGDIDDVASLRERHILDKVAQQLLALNEHGRWSIPERWQVMSKLANLLALRGAKQKRRRFGQQGVLSLQLFHLSQLLIPLPFQAPGHEAVVRVDRFVSCAGPGPLRTAPARAFRCHW
jgi:hypothetical protein